MTASVGILAYGSLIDDPGNEIAPHIRLRLKCQTPFKVEFARKSTGRKDAPTLVPFEAGSPVDAVILVVDLSVSEATNRLYRREINKVGSDTSYVPPAIASLNSVIIETWNDLEGIETVLYTSIGANIDDPSAETLAKLAIASASALDDGRDGISYLRNAMAAGIETPLTKAYVAEVLRLTNTADLPAALSHIRVNASDRQ
jgi:hypothetical protein